MYRGVYIPNNLGKKFVVKILLKRKLLKKKKNVR